MQNVRRRNDQTARISLLPKTCQRAQGQTKQPATPPKWRNQPPNPRKAGSGASTFARRSVNRAATRAKYGGMPPPARGKREVNEIFFAPQSPPSRCSGLGNRAHKRACCPGQKHPAAVLRRGPCRTGRAARAGAIRPARRQQAHKAPALPTRP